MLPQAWAGLATARDKAHTSTLVWLAFMTFPSAGGESERHFTRGPEGKNAA
jgi:hypothetical protein